VIAILILAAAVVGYVVGRIRPQSRLSCWAIDEIRYGGKWASGSKARQVTLLAVWALAAPRDAIQTWRSRNDQPVEPVRIVLSKEQQK
jgi:hypothetical protein